MRKVLFNTFIIILIFSCSGHRSQQKTDLNEVINGLLRYNLAENPLVVLDLNQVVILDSVKIFENGDSLWEDEPPPPPGFGKTCYSRSFIESLVKDKWLEINDVDFMVDQVKSNQTNSLNPQLIESETINKTQIDFIFRNNEIDNAYQLLKKHYHVTSFIEISQPLMSKDGNTMILDIDVHCGSLCGGGTTFLFKKLNGRWKLVFQKGNWIS